MARSQFKILYRDFLFRVVDPELLSPHSPGDSHRMLTQIAAILVVFSVAISLPAFDASDGTFSAPLRILFAWRLEHFLIATSMLAIGLFAVMSWGSLFPEHRDVLILAPLPVRAGTVLKAKVAAVAAALGLAVLAMHVVAGLAWPVALGQLQRTSMPALARDAAAPPVTVSNLRSVMDRDLASAVRDGWLAPGQGGALVIATSHHGVRQMWTYGDAQENSIFQIGSVTKTFTALALARAVHDGRVRLDTPVRDLVPSPRPLTRDLRDRAPITLEDLATHYAGFDMMPPGRPEQVREIFAGFTSEDLRHFLRRYRLVTPLYPRYKYSNLGFAVLGQVLATQTSLDYPDLLRDQITGPLGLSDTVFSLTDEQQARLVAGYDDGGREVGAWRFSSLAPAGGLYSTAPDLLTWVEAHLHPRAEWRDATALVQRARRPVQEGVAIGLGWQVASDNATFHDGAVGGYSAKAYFNPGADLGIVVLANRGMGVAAVAPRVADHMLARIDGVAPESLSDVPVGTTGGLRAVARAFWAYWLTMIAASAFIASAVIGIQGLASAVLPRRVFLRATFPLQFTAFAAIVAVYLLLPIMFTHSQLLDVETGPAWAAPPSYWFLALFQRLNGYDAMPVLASRALVGVAAAVVLSTFAYGVSYLQTLRRIAESPDLVSVSTRAIWIGGHGPLRALTEFSIKTLLRSGPPRMVMALYWGLGLAFAIAFMKTPRGQELFDTYDAGSWRENSVPLLLASTLMMGASVMAARSAFAMPRDLSSNWIFQLLQARNAAVYAQARRVAFLAVSVLPVSAVSALVFLSMWPPLPALAHVLALTLLGVVFVEAVNAGERRIPFASSVLPGKTRINIAITVILMVIIPVALSAARFEREALADARLFGIMIAVLAASWVVAAVFTRWLRPAPSGLPPFETVPEDRSVTMDLWDTPRVARRPAP